MSNNMLGCPGEDLLGIAVDFMTKLHNGTITPLQAKRFLRKEDPFTIPIDKDAQLQRWASLIAEAFGINIDPASIEIPEQQSGFDRLVVVPQGITLNQIAAACRRKFDMYLYAEDLASVTVNDRTPGKTYVVWVRETVEADEKFANKSANDLKKANIAGITLAERLLQELMYFSETAKHLDIENVTLCSGSRNSDGRVPSVYCSPDDRKVYFNWYDPGSRSPGLRSPAVVS